MILSKLIENASSFRRWLYEKKILEIYKANHPVISVGNLTMGGSGKTPLIHWIVEEAGKYNLKPVVVCRSYKTSLKKWCRVNLANKEMYNLYGDEALLTAKKFPNLIVLSGPKKWESIIEYEKLNQEHFDFYIIDDGFQHLKIHRNFDILVFDSSQDQKHYQFPDIFNTKGRLRDKISLSSSADLIVINKIDQMSSDFRKNILTEIKSELSTSQFNINKKDLEVLKTCKSYLVCGIGNPNYFTKQLEINGIKWLKNYVFEDHKNYDAEFAAMLLADIQENQIDKVICTEKDLVKLEQFDDLKPYLHPIRTEIVFDKLPYKLINFIKSLAKDG